MGFRTVVILSNDMAHVWEKDPELGRKIAHDMNYVYDKDRFTELEGYGRVIECAHADTQTLMLIDSLDGAPITHDNWRRDETDKQVQIKLLRAAADKLGYRLSKKSEVE